MEANGAVVAEQQMAATDTEPVSDPAKWEELFNEKPSRLAHSYAELRDEVRAMLMKHRGACLYQAAVRGEHTHYSRSRAT